MLESKTGIGFVSHARLSYAPYNFREVAPYGTTYDKGCDIVLLSDSHKSLNKI